MVLRSLTMIWKRSQRDYCRVFCNEVKLKTIVHLLCNFPVWFSLRLKTLGEDFFKDLNSESRADIEALQKFITSLNWLRSARACNSIVAPSAIVYSSYFMFFVSLCISSVALFSLFYLLSFFLISPIFLLPLQHCTMGQLDLQEMYSSQMASTHSLTLT